MEPQTLQEILSRGETATVKFNGRVVGVPEAAISDNSATSQITFFEGGITLKDFSPVPTYFADPDG